MHIDFTSSRRASLGVEWELELVDLDTRQLASASDDILAAISPGGEHPKAKHELLQSCVEVITGICQTVGQAREDLAGTVAEVSKAADERNLGVMCSGTHPITDWTTQRITDNARYALLVDRNQWVARQLQIFGVHVHVGVRAPNKAMPIVNGLLSYLPHFLALSASSPYWIGSDTGLASYRSKVFEALPTAGLPYQLSGWHEFEKYMDALISSHTIESVREVWWDIRPHPGFGTVELRICDGMPTLDEIVCVAALAWSSASTASSTTATRCPSRGRGWFARTSGAPPDTAWTPRSWSTTPAACSPSPRRSPTWSTTCSPSRGAWTASANSSRSRGSSSAARATSASEPWRPPTTATSPPSSTR